jgi:uncharacterized RDD family membrane protein YckC
MRDARREGSPYPKADLTLRGLARLADLTLALAVSRAFPPLGPVLAAIYLLAADGLFTGQSIGKKIFGVRTVVIPTRAPAGYRESFLRNVPFALVALFGGVAWFWILFVVAGIPIVAFEAWMVWSDRLGIRIGDIFADTQVVDAKVVAKDAALAQPLQTAAPAPPGPSARAASPDAVAAGPRAA